MSRSFFRTYGFLGAMLLSIVLGCVLGALWPQAACLAPLGTIFINLMFCIVVPLVFCSLAGSIACMKSPRRAGKIMGTTLLVFVVTGLIASVIMVILMRLYPPVLKPWTDAAAGAVDEQAGIAELLVNFFTVEDFAALLSRRAMLPLIVFSILTGFAVNLSGGAECLTAKFLQDMTNCLLKLVSLISYYAPSRFLVSSPPSLRPMARRSPLPTAARCSSITRSASPTRSSPSRSTRASAVEGRALPSCGVTFFDLPSRRSVPALPLQAFRPTYRPRRTAAYHATFPILFSPSAQRCTWTARASAAC